MAYNHNYKKLINQIEGMMAHVPVPKDPVQLEIFNNKSLELQTTVDDMKKLYDDQSQQLKQLQKKKTSINEASSSKAGKTKKTAATAALATQIRSNTKNGRIYCSEPGCEANYVDLKGLKVHHNEKQLGIRKRCGYYSKCDFTMKAGNKKVLDAHLDAKHGGINAPVAGRAGRLYKLPKFVITEVSQ